MMTSCRIMVERNTTTVYDCDCDCDCDCAHQSTPRGSTVVMNSCHGDRRCSDAQDAHGVHI